MQLKETMQKLTADADRVRDVEPKNLSTMKVLDEWRQGDMRLIRLPDDFVKKHGGELEAMKPEAQLAPGSTQGSRHILETLTGVSMYRLKHATPPDGPVFVLSQSNTITHPEHAHLVKLPAGCYAVPGQRAFADELRRQAD